MRSDSVLCVSVVNEFVRKEQPQSHRGHRGHREVDYRLLSRQLICGKLHTNNRLPKSSSGGKQCRPRVGSS